MRTFVALVPALLLAAPLSAYARHTGNNLDVYYMSSGLEITVPGFDSFDDSGDGFGVKGQFSFAPDLFITGEYQSTTLDDLDADLDQLRIGIGGRAQIGQQLWGRLQGEYFDAEYDGEDLDDGFGMHAGIEFDAEPVLIYADLGYLMLGDADGPEFLIGAAFEFAPSLGVFVDYRLTSLEVDDGTDTEFEFDDFRAGVRFTF
ncbi:MAG: outer membrane beta-barrel protein [Pseudomonadota bacterium]|nr:outer membrane beta-barrel protein [Pseudomonadota bacterium]